MNKFLVLMLIPLFCFFPLQAATFYLDAVNGSDSTGDGSSSQPWASMDRAFDSVSPGDTVLLRPGNYGSVAFEQGEGLGDSTGYITYMADPATVNARPATWYDQALDRPDPADPDGEVIFTNISFESYVQNWNSSTLEGDPVGHYVKLDGLNVVGGNITLVSFVSEVEIRNCNVFGNWSNYSTEITRAAFRIYRAVELGSNYRNILIEDCYGTDCRGGTILLGNCYNVTVRGCHFHHHHGPMVSMNAGSKELVTIENNHIHDQEPVADTQPTTRYVVTPDASEPDRIFTVSGTASYYDLVIVTDADTNIEQMGVVSSFNTSTLEVVLAEPMDFDVESGDTAVFWDRSHGSGLAIRTGGFTFRGNRLYNCGGTGGIYLYDPPAEGLGDFTLENNLIYSSLSQYTVNFENGLGDNVIIRNNTIAGYKHSNYDTSGTANLYYGFALHNCDVAPNADASTITIANNLLIGRSTAPDGAIVKGNIVFASDDFDEDSTGDNANNLVYYDGESAGNEPHPFDGSGNFFVGGGLFDTLAFTTQHSENFNDAFQLVSTADAVGFADSALATSTDMVGLTRDAAPDAGAYEYDGPVQTGPVANAGSDQLVDDLDGSGSESIQLDGSGSYENGASIVSYVWTENSSQIATGVSPTVSLCVGTHEITLTVTDSNNDYDTDVVIVTVAPQDTELLIFGDFETSWGDASTLGSDVTLPVTVDSSVSADWETIMVGDWVRQQAGNWHNAPAGTGNDSDLAASLRKTYGTAQALTKDAVGADTTLLLNWDYHVPTGLATDTTFTVRLFGVNEASAGQTATQFSNFSTTVNDSSTVTGEASNFSEIFNMSVVVDCDDATNGTWQSATEQQIYIADDWDYLVVIFGRNSGTDNNASLQMDNISLQIYSEPNAAPEADAGEDQSVMDTDDSGSEQVQLDGTGSSDTDGSIVSYVWSEGGSQIATGATPTVSLSTGTHTITLVVTDDDNDTDSDTVEITVTAGGNLLSFGDFETSWGLASVLGSDVTLPVTVDSSTTSDWETIMIDDWVRQQAGNWHAEPAGTGNDSDKAAALRKPYGTAQVLPLDEIASGDSLVLNWDYHVPAGLAVDTTFAFRIFGVNEAGSGEIVTQFNNFSTAVNDSSTVSGESANYDEIFNMTLTVAYDDATNGTWQSSSPSQISVDDDWDYIVLVFGMSSGVLNNVNIQIDNISLIKAVSSGNSDIEGDVDSNGTVDVFDFLILRSNYGSSAATSDMGDLDADGDVDIMDFLILRSNYGK